MKAFFALAEVVVPVPATRVAMARDGRMTDRGACATGWTGGYGGGRDTALAFLAVVGLVAWTERQVCK